MKRANDNIMNIYSNYTLENEKEDCDSDEEGDDSEALRRIILSISGIEGGKFKFFVYLRSLLHWETEYS